MTDLKLEVGEGILLQTSDASRYDGKRELDIDALYLTNRNLICVYEKSNGFFSSSETTVDKVPLSMIAVINSVVQIELVDDDEYGKTLQIIYTNGKRELIELSKSPRKQYPIWKAAISDAVIRLKTERKQQKTPVTSAIDVASEEKEHIFCPNCGIKLRKGSRFCNICGNATDNKEVKQVETVSSSDALSPVEPFSMRDKKTNADASEKIYSESTTERKTVYEGAIHKCPNCGEVLNSFKTHCPACGFEIREGRLINSVRELVLKLEKIEAQKMPHIDKKESVMKKVFGKDFEEEDEVEEARERFEEHKIQQKVNLIINFPVPNIKEDILELMFLAASNINVKKGLDDEVTKAWLTKLELVYEKAQLLMGGSPDFEQVKNIYDSKKNQIKARRKKILSIVFGCIAGYLALIGLLLNPGLTVGIIVGIFILVVIGVVLLKKK